MNGKIFLPLNHLCLRTVGFEYHLVDVSLAHENDEDVDALDHVQEVSEVPEKILNTREYHNIIVT